MLQRNEGYIFAEMLLSLASLLLVTGILLPMVVLSSKQAEHLQIEIVVMHLLYDELERQIDEGALVGSRVITLNNISYEIVWEENLLRKEVCIEYRDEDSTIQRKCQISE